MSNPFVHLELNTPDLAKAKEFYGKMFGWEFNDSQMPVGTYSTFKPSSGPGGGMFTMPGGPVAWLPYIGVEEIKAATEQAASLGAKVCMACHEIPGVGWISMLTDPVGATIALFQPKPGSTM